MASAAVAGLERTSGPLYVVVVVVVVEVVVVGHHL
jgi:hypothetical protein